MDEHALAAAVAQLTATRACLERVDKFRRRRGITKAGESRGFGRAEALSAQ